MLTDRIYVGEIRMKAKHAYKAPRHLFRKYKKLENAVSRLTSFLFLNGQVGDYCVIYHDYTGFEYCVLKVTLDAQISIKWVRQPMKLKAVV